MSEKRNLNIYRSSARELADAIHFRIETLHDQVIDADKKQAEWRTRLEKAERERDAWKARAVFLWCEGTPDERSDLDPETDEDAGRMIDDEMRNSPDHWGTAPHLARAAAPTDTEGE